MRFPEGFRVNGDAVNGNSVPQMVRNAIAIIEKLPFKELITSRQLAAMIGCQASSFRHHGPDPLLQPYRCLITTKAVLWGNKRTIKEFKRLSLRSAL